MPLMAALMFKLTLAALAATAVVNWRRRRRGAPALGRGWRPALAGLAALEVVLIVAALGWSAAGGA
ncbi:MAG: hypothetical protein AAF763_19760 [Pseudomonadota bacterium]